MSDFSKFYDVVDEIYHHTEEYFIGPIEEKEVIEVEDPLSRYQLGILWARSKNAESEDKKQFESMDKFFENNTEDNEEPANISIFKPSSMGLSFSVMPNNSINISFSYAVYHHSEHTVAENGCEIKKTYL